MKPIVDYQEICRLASNVLDGSGTAEEFERLESLLSASSDARQFYYQLMILHSQLAWNLGEDHRACLAAQPTPLETQVGPSLLRSLMNPLVSLPRPAFWSVVAAGVLFAAYFVGISWNLLDRPQRGSLGSDVAVAIITESETAQWTVDKTSPPGTQRKEFGRREVAIRAGESLQLESGVVEIKLMQGATIVVEGPAQWHIDGDNAATLNRGMLVANVPPAAHGFRLKTPSASIVDLGTKFGVDVADNGDANVHVLQGEVEIRDIGENRSQTENKRLQSGESIRVTSSGSTGDPKPGVKEKLKQLADGKTNNSLLKERDASRYAACVLALKPIVYLPVHREDGMTITDHAQGRFVGRFSRTAGPGEAWEQGPFGDALSFRGPQFTDRVTLESAPGNTAKQELTFSRGKEPGLPFTLTLWARCEPRQSTGLLVGKGHGFGSQFLLDVLSGRYRFVVHNSAKEVSGLINSQTAVDGTWQHVAAVFDPDRKSITLYVNGLSNLAATATLKDVSLAPVTEPVLIGNRDFPGDSKKLTLTGAIDEIAIFDRPLSSAEIESLYRLHPLHGKDDN